MYANPKSGRQGIGAIDGEITDWDTILGLAPPTAADSAEELLLKFLYRPVGPPGSHPLKTSGAPPERIDSLSGGFPHTEEFHVRSHRRHRSARPPGSRPAQG
ncbi:hypothetical protein [Herbidospora cretacea]|uniref:hypothetical protein n=1 Tax=Herbidospora cretacea TaxID=28444 RepID=UPI0018CC4DA9|nr:hypothetical protein [Herbidospora cretacea]